MSKPVIGIDLGTTNTCISYLNSSNKPTVIPNHLFHRTTPSYVTYLKPDQNVNELLKDLSIKQKNATDSETEGNSFLKNKNCKSSRTNQNNPAHIEKTIFSNKNIFSKLLQIFSLKSTTGSQKSNRFYPESEIHDKNNSTTQKIADNKGSLFSEDLDFFKDKKIIVGNLSKLLQPKFPSQTIYAFKRLIGRKFDDPTIQKFVESVPYLIKKFSNEDVAIDLRNNLVSPVEISSTLLEYAKKCAEKAVGPIEEAIITVPARFDDTQRQATKDAGEIAGLKVLRVLSEPTAAALAYGLNKEGNSIVAVYDLGGGTFDFSILELNNGVFEVKSVSGNTSLGGEDIDIAIMADVLKKIQGIEETAEKQLDNNKFGLHKDVFSSNFLVSKSKNRETPVNSFTLTPQDIYNSKNLESNDTGNSIKDKGVQTPNSIVSDALKNGSSIEDNLSIDQNAYKLSGRISLHQSDLVNSYSDSKNRKPFLVGDNLKGLKEEVEKMKIALTDQETYCLCINNHILTYTAQDIERIALPIIEKTILPVEEAIHDAQISKSNIDHVILVGGATKMPLVRKTVASIFNKPPNTSVDPDEAIAIGASIQAGILKNKINAVLLDVNGLSLGIETIGGLFSSIIDRNNKIPVKKTQIYTNSEDNQSEVVIKVYQGERPLVRNNKYLGELKMDLEKRKKGEHRIEVTFGCDVNGLLKVSAKDLLTNQIKHIVVNQASGLSKEEIKRIIKEAEERKKIDENAVECANFKLELRKMLDVLNLEENDSNVLKKYCELDVFDIRTAKIEIQSIISKNL